LTVYLTIAALAAFLWLVDGGDRYAALAGLMAGAASWTKLEGASQRGSSCSQWSSFGAASALPAAEHRVVRRIRCPLAGIPAASRHLRQPPTFLEGPS